MINRQLAYVVSDLSAAVAQRVSPGSTVVIESDARAGLIPFPELGLTDRTDRTYGGTRVTIIRVTAELAMTPCTVPSARVPTTRSRSDIWTSSKGLRGSSEKWLSR